MTQPVWVPQETNRSVELLSALSLWCNRNLPRARPAAVSQQGVSSPAKHVQWLHTLQLSMWKVYSVLLSSHRDILEYQYNGITVLKLQITYRVGERIRKPKREQTEASRHLDEIFQQNNFNIITVPGCNLEFIHQKTVGMRIIKGKARSCLGSSRDKIKHFTSSQDKHSLMNVTGGWHFPCSTRSVLNINERVLKVSSWCVQRDRWCRANNYKAAEY